MTILKGELATKQSIAIIRLFKAMKDYIVETKPLLDSMNRYIAIDIDDSFKLFHSGVSSKDGGNKITTIMEIEEPLKYKELFDELLLNEELIIE